MKRTALPLTFLALLLAATGARADMSQEMLAAHNEVRSGVGLPPLSWSEELTSYAAQWATHLAEKEQCRAKHRPYDGEFAQKHGENLYWGSPQRWSDGRLELQDVGASDVVRNWASEVAHYDYAKNRCSKVCGHYTQIVWRDSKQVGCAKAVCDKSKEQIWVCNYDPPGNWEGEKPY